MCVRETALSGIYYNGPSFNKVIIYQLTWQTLQVTVSSTWSHRQFEVPLCQRLYRLENIYLRNIAEAGARTVALQPSALATRSP